MHAESRAAATEPPYPLPSALDVQPPVVPGESVYRQYSGDGRWYPVRESEGSIVRYDSDKIDVPTPIIVTTKDAALCVPASPCTRKHASSLNGSSSRSYQA